MDKFMVVLVGDNRVSQNLSDGSIKLISEKELLKMKLCCDYVGKLGFETTIGVLWKEICDKHYLNGLIIDLHGNVISLRVVPAPDGFYCLNVNVLNGSILMILNKGDCTCEVSSAVSRPFKEINFNILSISYLDDAVMNYRFCVYGMSLNGVYDDGDGMKCNFPVINWRTSRGCLTELSFDDLGMKRVR